MDGTTSIPAETFFRRLAGDPRSVRCHSFTTLAQMAIQMYYGLYTSTEVAMARSTPAAPTSPAGRPRRGEAWPRKNMAMDPRKLAAAKRYLGVATETEAVDAALDLVAFQGEVLSGLQALVAAGPWQSPFSR